MSDIHFLIAAVFLFALGIYMARRAVSRPLKMLFLMLLVLLFLVFGTLSLVSIYFTGKGFDESVLYHLAYGVSGAGFADYKGIIASTLVFIMSGFVGLYWIFCGKGNIQKHADSRWDSIAAYLLLLGAISLVPGNRYFINNLLAEQKTDFYKYYRTPHITKRPDNKYNLVVIYAEGLERSFFDESRFPGLVKNLRDLEARSIYFTNLEQVWGTGWTIAGMTATQCGMPLVAISHGNSMSGMDEFLKDARCLGDLLSGEGYYLTYLGGSQLKFAGKGKFYSTHGFSNVRGRNELGKLLENPAYMGPWGLYDDSLFEIAYSEFEDLSKKSEPFGLFMLTLDTHPPDGNPSGSCKKIRYGDGTNPILNAVACSDYLIGDFVEKIINSGYAGNTVIVIASDHLSLKNTAHSLLESATRTNMLMIVDPGRHMPNKITRKGSMLDAGPAILRSLGYQGSIGLGRDLIAGESSLSDDPGDMDTALPGWRNSIMGFWEFPRIEQELVIDSVYRKMIINDREFTVPALVTFNNSLETEIRFEFDSSPIHMKLKDHVFDLGMGTPFVWIDNCRTVESSRYKYGLCVVAGKLGAGKLEITRIDGEIKLSLDTIHRITILETSQKNYIKNKVLLGYRQ
jgi:phosphoglycerol transferase